MKNKFELKRLSKYHKIKEASKKHQTFIFNEPNITIAEKLEIINHKGRASVNYNFVKVISFSFILFILNGCVDFYNRVKNIGSLPDLNKVEAPMTKKDYYPVQWPDDDMHQNQTVKAPIKIKSTNKNSLWKPGARTFFRDQRARRVGDILKISININDNVSIGNKTEQIRNNKTKDSAPNLFGIEKRLKNFIKDADPSNLVNIATSGDVSGEGKITRSEAIKTQIAAIVTQILPNGNLVIRGHQEVRVNFEIREIVVEGIVRPEDISSENAIDSNLIAEARISYGGRGNISNLQQPRYGNQILDIISPF